MSKELKNITKIVMEKIHHDKIKMHSKVYFAIGSVIAFAGLVASILVSVFLFGLVRYSLRTHGPMGEYRFDRMLSSFPWWMVIIAILGLIIGIWLLRQYDFSYKINFMVLAIVFVGAIIIAGWIIDMTGLNDILFKKGRGQGMRTTVRLTTKDF